jgi:hypothetical protein
MSGLHIKKTGKAYLLNESDMEGMVFNTPVPFFDAPVSCGIPKDTGDVPAVWMMMPDDILGANDTYCTRAKGDSMIGANIMTGDLLVMEMVPEYHSHDIVLADIDGERTLKTYYLAENGEQWLIPSNKKYKARRIDGTMNVRFLGKVKAHLRHDPQDTMAHIMESIEEARAQMAVEQAQSEDFKKLVISPACADKVVGRLHELSDGKQKPRDILMPLRAAMEAGAIRRPTWAEYGSEFGFKRTSKTSLSDYTDPTKNKYADEQQFWSLVDIFRSLIAR